MLGGGLQAILQYRYYVCYYIETSAGRYALSGLDAGKTEEMFFYPANDRMNNDGRPE